MSIIRRKRNGNFTTIPNHVFEAEIAIDTLGLLCFFLGLPHDWKVNEKHITERFGFGRDRYRRMITELIEAGYLVRETLIGEDGRFAGQEIRIYDEPPTGDGLSGDGLHGASGKPDTILKKHKNTKDTKVYKKGSRLPEDWEPTQSDREFCFEMYGNGWGSELERFKDYWKGVPGQRGVKLDWDATWRNWIRTAADDTKKTPYSKAKVSNRETALEALARVASDEG